MRFFKVTYLASVVVEAVDLDRAAQIVSDLAFDVGESSMPIIQDIQEFEDVDQGPPEREYEPDDQDAA